MPLDVPPSLLGGAALQYLSGRRLRRYNKGTFKFKPLMCSSVLP